ARRPARPEDRALLLAADVRRRAVHGAARRVREARGHGPGLRGDPRRQARRPRRAGLLHGRHDRGGGRRRPRGGAGRGVVSTPEARTLEVALVTPEGAVYEGEAELLIVPGDAGEIGVLARHAPLVALLKAGSTRVHVRRGQDVREFATGPG